MVDKRPPLTGVPAGRGGIPVRAKDSLRLGGMGSVTDQLRAFVRFMNVAGEIRPISIDHTVQSSRNFSESSSEIFGEDGWIIGDPVIGGSGVAYGRVWARLRIQDTTLRANVVVLAQGKMGTFKGIQGIEDLEPTDGKGALVWNQEANDVAGSVTTTVNLAATNTRRLVRGALVKYHAASDVATRTLTITLRDLGDTSGPTGFTISQDTWVSPTLTLTANEEGVIHVGDHGFVSVNDAGTITYADNTTAPNPFPMWVERDATADLIIAAGSGHANDDYDAFIYVEEWFVG